MASDELRLAHVAPNHPSDGIDNTVTVPLSMILTLAMLLVVGVAIVVIYNRLVRGRLLVREAFSGIDVQLKRRHDLIPNLVSTVKGYAAHEKGVLEEVTRLRAEAMSDLSLADRQRDENQLTAALKSLLVVAERYPDLKANQGFLNLQQQLVDIEDDLQKARRYYNGTVRDFNTRVESFPSNLVAAVFGFQQVEFFELAGLEEAAVPRANLSPTGEV